MKQMVNINIKMDADVKKSMEQACADMGLSMSAAFTIFAKRWEESVAFHSKLQRIHSIAKAISDI